MTGTAQLVPVQIEDVRPRVHGGRGTAKAVVGEAFPVTALVFVEGSGIVRPHAVLRDPDGRTVQCVAMREQVPGSDRWSALLTPSAPGRWSYCVQAWCDTVAAWRRDAAIKVPAGVDSDITLEEGAVHLEGALGRVTDEAARRTLFDAIHVLADPARGDMERLAAALSPEVREVLDAHPQLDRLTESSSLPLLVERERALYGAWYEFF
ncbi:maltotransferase domain-containing protein, partial [Streptomyces sp. NPDC050264]|uniref:maltotransferase domain-containing protein n=1 Tax=Streptomyces sp. NPDC050264 TaxID=3155038 RepID=UPI00342F36B1